jgi:transcriptional regulator with XRE-family HTH domain
MFLWRYTLNILRFSNLLSEKRGEKGVREFARELGISPATLSRIERGKLPDLETFEKLCSALKIDPAEMLEIEVEKPKARGSTPRFAEPAVHFRAEAHFTPEAAQDLAALILAAQDFVQSKA